MRWLMVLTSTLLLLCACSAVRVSQDYRPATDFSNLKTYRWQPISHDIRGDKPMDDPLRDERIREAVEQNLYALGFREAPADRPDFFVDVQYSVYQVLKSGDVRKEVGIGTWGGPDGPFDDIGLGSRWEFYTRHDGMLYIDVIDPQDGRILWRGKGTHQVEQHWSPRTKIQKINELVGKVLSQFPPSERPADAIGQ